MILKRHVLALFALSFGLTVGACAQVSGSVSDAWPHWAGGEPANMPPRPGTPGYQDFIAHGQAGTGAQPPAATTGSTVAQPAPVANVNPGAPPPQSQPPADNTIARGNLY